MFDPDPEICPLWQRLAVGAESRYQALVKSGNELIICCHSLLANSRLFLSLRYDRHQVLKRLRPNAALTLGSAPKKHEFVLLQAHGERIVKLATCVDLGRALRPEEAQVIDYFVVGEICVNLDDLVTLFIQVHAEVRLVLSNPIDV